MGLRRDAGQIRGRRDLSRLRPLDLAGQVADGEVAIATRQCGGERGEDLHLRRQDPGQVPAVDARPEVAELPQGRGVEGECGDAPTARRCQSIAHLGGGLVRERHDEHIRRADRLRRERVRDPSCDHPRLARAGAGEDAHGPADRGDRLSLGRVQVGEQRVGVGGGHPTDRSATGCTPHLRGLFSAFIGLDPVPPSPDRDEMPLAVVD